MSRTSMDFCSGSLLPKMLEYTYPVILTGVLQLLFNAADLVVIGQCCGGTSVAAVGATSALINLIVNLFIGLSVGAGVAVAQGVGAGSHEQVSRTVHTAVPTALLCGILLTVVGVSCSEQFLSWMGTPDNVLPLSAVYMRIYFSGIIFSMLYNFGAAILRAIGETRAPMYYLFIAGTVNVLLNLLFVLCLHMDVAGVALATMISQVISAILVMVSLIRREDACQLSLREMHIDRTQLGKILRIGLPAGIQGSLFAISNVIIQSSINSFGDVVLVGNSAAANIEGFVYITMNSFYQTAMNFTGQNYGAGKFDRIRKIMIISILSVLTAGLAAGGTVFAFARPLLRIYITTPPEAIEYGVIRITCICLPYCLCGLMDVSTGLIRGLGASIAPMCITIMGVCVFRIIWIYTVFQIPAYHTQQGLYISYTISWAITFAVQMAVFCCLLRRKKLAAASAGIPSKAL